MKTTEKNNIYFLGAGGIGMSALARYFKNMGTAVAGYDRTSTSLTSQLIKEGIDIHFEDSVDLIPETFKNSKDTLVVYTPAIPADQEEFVFFKNNGFEMVKRAYTLGLIANPKKCIAVAGTHGKTSVTTIISFLLKNSAVKCSAFLGGISKNFETNYLYSADSDFVVAEADEYDRSFLNLNPYIAVITAIDPDHLEIYNNKENIVASFNQFINQVKEGGKLIINGKIVNLVDIPPHLNYCTYSLYDSQCDYYVTSKEIVNGLYTFSLQTPEGEINNITLGIPGEVNLENTVAAVAAALNAGVKNDEVINSLTDIKGVKRRFDILYKTEYKIYIDDYAHHPEEIKRFLQSVRSLFPDKKIAGIFQPHLYSRTQDFADEFAKSLSLLDTLYLLDIYPAREKPIPGVTSDIIFRNVSCNNKYMCSKNEFPQLLAGENCEIIVTIGAGDIDTLIEKIIGFLKSS